MKPELTLANAKLVLADDVVTGSLRIQDGQIVAIDVGSTTTGADIDCEGDLLIPGLVELHTDNLERHLQPRPKVDWPHAAAILAHDAELASVGITTVFDALRIGSVVSNDLANYGKYARQVASEILDLRARRALRISHFLHLRAEVCSETLIEEINEFDATDRVGIVSLMDHTPGQRQFRDTTKYRDYVCGKHGLPLEDFDAYIAEKLERRAKYGDAHEAAAVAGAKRLGAILASHDDTTRDHVEQSAAHGIKLAEFPTTLEAAQACKENGIITMMGAPNQIRGGSHSGNVASQDLAENDLLGILSSDYIPSALLMAALQLGDLWGNLPKGIATVTRGPARAAGLSDRGTLEVGKRADIVRVGSLGATPMIRGVWSEARRVG